MVGSEALKEEYLPAPLHFDAQNPRSPFNYIDVVAVQGLGSNYDTTWIAYEEHERPCMWLRDLLPHDLRHARIQTFRYDSKWYQDPDYVSLRECGRRLLYALLADRTHHNQHRLCPTRRKRPLILIGHSFGGLVINQCLVLASQVMPDDSDLSYEDCKDLLKAVAGVVYLGVPHRGSTFAKWGLRKSWLGGLTGKRSYPDILKVLAIDTTTSVLDDLREDFGKLSRSTTLNGIQLICFYETKGIKLGVVVDKPSACLDGVPSDSLAANHFDMNKFIPGENYDRVRKRLNYFSECAPSIIKKRYDTETYANPVACPQYQRIHSFLDAKVSTQILALDQLISRRDPDTCKWTEHHDVLQRWSGFKGHDNFAWMFGMPGSGKTVLAAAIVEGCELQSNTTSDCWNEMSNEQCAIPLHRHKLPSIAYYFAGFVEEDFVCSNVLRGIIHQCLISHNDHHDLLASIGDIVAKDQSKSRRRITVLVNILGEIARQTGGIRIVVDGFNELKGWEELVKVLSSFRSHRKIRVLFVGHPNDQPLGTNLEGIRNDGMAFDIIDYTREDIKLFIRKRVDLYRHKWPGHADLADRIEEVLLRKSQGMYQWVTLVLDVIERYGASADEASRALEDFPTGLQAMYVKIFGRLIDRPQIILSRVREALRFLSVNLGPVTLLELFQYVRTRLAPQDALEDILLEDSHVMDTAVEGFREALGSLVVTHPISSRIFASTTASHGLKRRETLLVELCHSSLRQLILSEFDTAASRDADLIKTFASTKQLTHRDAAIVCLQIATRSFGSLICYSYYTMETHDPPLVHYAYEFWFSHLVASDFVDEETVLGHVRLFRDRLLQDSATLIGSISLAVRSDVAGLGPDTGGIPKTASVVDLQSSLLRAATTAQSLLDEPFRPIHQSGHLLKNGPASTTIWTFFRNCRARYRRWRRRHYFSSTAIAICSLESIPEGEPADFESYMDRSLDAVEALQLLALEIAMNPIRWQVLQPSRSFSPVVPFLLASHALESVMLWPINDHLKVASSHPWNISKDSRLYERLLCAVAEIEDELSDAERLRRTREARKYYTLSGSNFLIIGTYMALHQGSALADLLKAPLLNRWLNTQVHVESRFTRGFASLGRPVTSLTKSLMGTDTYLDMPQIFDTVLAFPTILALTLAAFLRASLERAKWWLWLALQWHYDRLRLAYINYSLIPTSLWNHYRPYIIPGLLLYLLRCKYWPTLGQHWRPNAYGQIQLAIVAPLDWIASMSDWTWLDFAKYQMMYWAMFGLTSAHLFVPRTWPLLREPGHVLMALQQFLILERTVCQIVNAVLSVSVPILLFIQPETTTLTADPEQTFRDSVLRPLADTSITIFLTSSIRMSIPLLVLYYSDNKGLLSMLVQPYIVAVALPMFLVFTVLLLIFLTGLLFRPTVHKDPGDAFLMSLLGACAIFLVIHVQRRVEEDPWELEIVWKGYKKAAKVAQQITGSQIMSLEVEIDRHRIQYQDVSRAEEPDTAIPSSSHEAGPLFTREASEMDSTDAVKPDSESRDGNFEVLRAAQYDTDASYIKDKDV